jgi:glucuronoarabinoxylan endo-1,4-beta-xylanase
MWSALRVGLVLSAAVSVQSCRCADAAIVEVLIDPEIEYQTLEGFGTSIIGWSSDFRDYYDQPAFQKFFLEELGATVLRVDLSGESVPERENWQDIDHRNFALTEDRERGATYLKVAAALTRRAAGNLRVIASVWSPPAWMKENGTSGNGHPKRKNFALSAQDLGIVEQDDGRPATDPESRERYLLVNRLRRDRYQHFAKSLVEWVRLYRAHGVELYALSPQNEPRFSHWFGSAVYTPRELADVLEAIVDMFEREREPMPRLFAPETMMQDVAGNQAYIEALMGSAVVAERIHALAVHGYVDGYKADEDPESPARFSRLALPYGKPIWLTEGGTGAHDWPAPLDGLGASMMNALTAGQASLIVPWQVVDREPNHHGLMPLAGPTKKTAVAQHFFRAFRPGMRRVRAVTENPLVAAVAMMGEAVQGDRQLSVVLINRSKGALRIHLRAVQVDLRLMATSTTDRQKSLQDHAFGSPSALEIPGQGVLSVTLRARERVGAERR